MPSYENRPIPEGINVSQQHPLKEFAWLLLAIGGTLLIAVFLLSLLAEKVANKIPFETEVHLAEATGIGALIEAEDYQQANSEQVLQWLQTLSKSFAEIQDLPADMQLVVHYQESETVNAFATLGGHIIMHQGLIEKMPNENAVAMVLAHEIAHIKHRDPIVAAGRGLTVGLALASLAGFGDGVADQILGQVGTLTILRFNREQERAADEEALKTLLAYYGHVEGAEALFDILQQQHDLPEPPAFLSTHPITAERIQAINDFAETFTPENSDRQLTDLPSFLQD